MAGGFRHGYDCALVTRGGVCNCPGEFSRGFPYRFDLIGEGHYEGDSDA